MKKLLIVAGEASADLYAARILEAVRERLPDVDAFGVGGTQLIEKGFRPVVRADDLSVVGGADWFGKISHVLAKFRLVCDAVKNEKPAAALLLDLPDFNLRLAKRLKRQGVRVLYFISPQVWAWRSSRVRQIRRDVDRMMVVFPFEQEFYRKHGYEADYVGHPLIEMLEPRTTYRQQTEILSRPRIAILPGSRRSELDFHRDLLVEAVRRLREKHPACEFQIPVATTLERQELEIAFADTGVKIAFESSWEVLRWADIAWVASGTATLETALIGTPQLIFYRMHWSTAFAVRHIIRYRSFLGMPNVLAKKEIVPEFLFERATGGQLAEETSRLLASEDSRNQMTGEYATCRQMLQKGGAIQNVASHLVEALNS